MSRRCRRQRRARPLGQAGVAGVVRHVLARVEGELAPDDELIEELFGRRRHAPPSLARAGPRPVDLPRRPALVRHHGGEDFVARDVPEMQVGRQPARRVGIGMIVIVAVAGQLRRDEGMERFARCRRYRPHLDRRYVVIDRQRPQRGRRRHRAARRLPAAICLRCRQAAFAASAGAAAGRGVTRRERRSRARGRCAA